MLKSVKEVTKEEIIADVRNSGCEMLNEEVDESITKDELVQVLRECDCPAIKKLYKTE